MKLSAKYLQSGAIVIVLIIASIALILGDDHKNPRNSACGPYRTDRVLTISSAKINAELATTQAERVLGLGGRPCILPDQAMLFDFGKPGQYGIWMKGMRFSIDIVWIGTNHKVVGFYNNIAPSTYPDSFANKSDSPAQYVLELRDNRATELHITIGTPVQF